MSPFGKKPATIIVCPICTTRFDEPEKLAHWTTHVTQIPTDAELHAGQCTWTCVCGPTDMVWPDEHAAAAGLALHMQHRHNIPT
jgi:hypothetical protein